jgi:polar amino acid transport system substrate-binding protein
MRPSSTLAAAALVALTSASLAADIYDLSPEQPSRIHVQADPALAAKLPADFKWAQPGSFTVAIAAAGEPPLATYATDAQTVVGSDPDIASQLAEILGLKLNLVAVAWPDWPLGLSSGKYDAVISNVGVTEERKLKFDFSTYRQGLHGFFVKTDSKITSIKEPKDVAGLKIATSSGTIQDRIINEWSDENVKAGLPASEILYYDDTAATLLAIQSGLVDAIFNVNSVYTYQGLKTGAIRLVGNVNAGWPNIADVGVVTRKDSGLADVLTAAINELITDGAYAKTLEQWKLTPESIPTSKTNPPGLPKY